MGKSQDDRTVLIDKLISSQSQRIKHLRIAIVHDFLIQRGGAEKVLETLCEMFPDAPIYTLIYDKEKMRGKFSDKIIRTSFLQKFPKILKIRYRRLLLPFMPVAIEMFDLREFDLIISSSGAWSKGVVTRLNTKHISYIHSPIRFLWDYNEKYLKDNNKKIGLCKRMFLTYLRLWDYQATQRPDVLIANSRYTQERIKKYYRRESNVIYPGVSVKNKQEKNKKRKDRNYFLVVSRLSAYKKINLVVEAFNKLELPLIVIGEGEQKKYLQKISKKNIKILGWKNDDELRKYYENARAFIFPTIDDFGMTMIEAMNYGIPVVAINRGGAKEIVKRGVTGELFDAQTTEVLADGVRRFINNEKKYNKKKIQEYAKEFSVEKFKKELKKNIDKLYDYRS